MIITHIERYATPAGISGIDANTASTRWEAHLDGG
jgi:hypothetical protein